MKRKTKNNKNMRKNIFLVILFLIVTLLVVKTTDENNQYKKQKHPNFSIEKKEGKYFIKVNFLDLNRTKRSLFVKISILKNDSIFITGSNQFLGFKNKNYYLILVGETKNNVKIILFSSNEKFDEYLNKGGMLLDNETWKEIGEKKKFNILLQKILKI